MIHMTPASSNLGHSPTPAEANYKTLTSRGAGSVFVQMSEQPAHNPGEWTHAELSKATKQAEMGEAVPNLSAWWMGLGKLIDLFRSVSIVLQRFAVLQNSRLSCLPCSVPALSTGLADVLEMFNPIPRAEAIWCQPHCNNQALALIFSLQNNAEVQSGWAGLHAGVNAWFHDYSFAKICSYLPGLNFSLTRRAKQLIRVETKENRWKKRHQNCGQPLLRLPFHREFCKWKTYTEVS